MGCTRVFFPFGERTKPRGNAPPISRAQPRDLDGSVDNSSGDIVSPAVLGVLAALYQRVEQQCPEEELENLF